MLDNLASDESGPASTAYAVYWSRKNELTVVLQLKYSDLKPSQAVLADKREYHAKLLGQAKPGSKKRE